jgi:hypothetical protein
MVRATIVTAPSGRRLRFVFASRARAYAYPSAIGSAGGEYELATSSPLNTARRHRSNRIVHQGWSQATNNQPPARRSVFA